ncbi:MULTISPECIES: hypothetical protein [unclassified Exiguobacterium]|uniref:hypothetical protein n=1 Tax=unclassified Exiguobacterium TaxID=2644629 RepID=UPI0003C411C3|nr:MULTISPECIES: hypothetical protein [unclassified Exiguobacterium]AHA31485.1 hypothetical protein U719_10490 [Exiguobacterium sp. MH3]NTY09905.1 hypothetical protein [Exiguobacterium sp. JMULE1]
MTVVYILLAALICYALLVLFRQQADLKDRISRLELEKSETEQVLLSFMEQVNEMTEQNVKSEVSSNPINETYQNPSIESVLPEENGVQNERAESYIETPVPSEVQNEEQVLTDVEQALREGTDLETLARSLNRGTGEVALIAKLSRQTKVAPR